MSSVSVLDYSSLFMAFSFAEGKEFSLPGAVLDYFPGVWWVGQGATRDAWVMLTCFFCSFMQAAFEPAVGEKWHH
jgi:hypothetical protein